MKNTKHSKHIKHKQHKPLCFMRKEANDAEIIALEM